MILEVKNLMKRFVHFFYPRCLTCELPLLNIRSSQLFCELHLKELNDLNYRLNSSEQEPCPVCSERYCLPGFCFSRELIDGPIDRSISFFSFEGVLKNLLIRSKGGSSLLYEKTTLELFLKELFFLLNSLNPIEFPNLIYGIPPSRLTRLGLSQKLALKTLSSCHSFGSNNTALIKDSFLKSLVSPFLKKKQSSLNYDERMESYTKLHRKRIASKVRLRGSPRQEEIVHLWLIDDVLTTGATSRTYAEVLKQMIQKKEEKPVSVTLITLAKKEKKKRS